MVFHIVGRFCPYPKDGCNPQELKHREVQVTYTIQSKAKNLNCQFLLKMISTLILWINMKRGLLFQLTSNKKYFCSIHFLLKHTWSIHYTTTQIFSNVPTILPIIQLFPPVLQQRILGWAIWHQKEYHVPPLFYPT